MPARLENAPLSSTKCLNMTTNCIFSIQFCSKVLLIILVTITAVMMDPTSWRWRLIVSDFSARVNKQTKENKGKKLHR